MEFFCQVCRATARHATYIRNTLRRLTLGSSPASRGWTCSEARADAILGFPRSKTLHVRGKRDGQRARGTQPSPGPLLDLSHLEPSTHAPPPRAPANHPRPRVSARPTSRSPGRLGKARGARLGGVPKCAASRVPRQFAAVANGRQPPGQGRRVSDRRSRVGAVRMTCVRRLRGRFLRPRTPVRLRTWLSDVARHVTIQRNGNAPWVFAMRNLFSRRSAIRDGSCRVAAVSKPAMGFRQQAARPRRIAR